MSTNKFLIYLGNQNTPPTTAEEALDEESVFIGAIFDTSNEAKNTNQQINPITSETNPEWSVTPNTNYLFRFCL